MGLDPSWTSVRGVPSRMRPRLQDLTPGITVLRGYERAWLRPDLVAGATVGAMLVPQSMAYAELAGLPPEYGFYAVLGPLVVYAVVGTSRHLGVGPEPGTAILAATGVGAIAAGEAGRYVVLMAALALVVGALGVLGAVARLGFIASVLSKPVLVGYITGVGLTLLSSQIAAFTGVAIEAGRFFPRVAELGRELEDVDPAVLALGTATLVLVLVLRRWAPTWPGALIGVALASVVVWLASGAEPVVPVVGAIPEGLPVPGLPEVGWADVVDLLTFHGDLATQVPAFMRVRDRRLAEPWPAWTAIGAAQLGGGLPGVRIEIKATALL